MAPTVLHIRSETKPPVAFDEEFEAVGATLVPEGSWVDAPKDHIIIGLKELPEGNAPLCHSHIQFGHCYKYPENWDRYLSRFARGGGTLYDIEFLTDDSGRRVSAFGCYAGYARAAIALLAWSHQVVQPTTPLPSILSALGRCGNGAVDFCIAADIPTSNLLKWDIAETTAGGPFPEIAAADIFINCVYLSTPITPFITFASLVEQGASYVLRATSAAIPTARDPMPIYHEYSTFIRPTLPVHVEGDGPPLTGKVEVVSQLPLALKTPQQIELHHIELIAACACLELSDSMQNADWSVEVVRGIIGTISDIDDSPIPTIISYRHVSSQRRHLYGSSTAPSPLKEPTPTSPRVLVIGGGVVGLTTAWLLLDQGFKVAILAKEWASFAD
ncbi:MAG: Saccharopine dehydrogenase [Geoglossum simile]|nr:MAG: Saccharopine dehydrogenase [Geoglossum simile]